MQFFSNEEVIQQGRKLFTDSDPTVWMHAAGSFSWSLPAPKAKQERFVGIVRGPIASAEKSIAIFHDADVKKQRAARARGLLSHNIFIKMNAPGDAPALELLGVDVWCDAAGMVEQYSDPGELVGLTGAFSGRPDATTWRQAPGAWSEW